MAGVTSTDRPMSVRNRCVIEVFGGVLIRQSSFRRDVLWYGDIRRYSRPDLHQSVRQSQFSALFSFMLWHIELKFCIWLCFTVLQIKFECHHFASSFERVMSLFSIKIKEIRSFPHFSFTCFDILSWKFAYDFVLPYFRSSSSVVTLRQFL